LRGCDLLHTSDPPPALDQERNLLGASELDDWVGRDQRAYDDASIESSGGLVVT